MTLQSGTITLRPATHDDRRAVYGWMACSDITRFMMGPPDFDDAPIPTWEMFCDDYNDSFFDHAQPGLGRSFIIEHRGEAVGHISYSQMDRDLSVAELDIWMRDSSCCGRGFGHNAIDALCHHLHMRFGIQNFILRPSRRNPQAIRAYRKAGFVESELTRDERAHLGPDEYDDPVVMRRSFAKSDDRSRLA